MGKNINTLNQTNSNKQKIIYSDTLSHLHENSNVVSNTTGI